MTSEAEVSKFIKEFKMKMKMFGIIFLDNRNKNQQALFDLEITPNQRKKYIESIVVEDYSEGPIPDIIFGNLPLWVFGRQIKDKEVYIKISMGSESSSAVCISFHLAEHPMKKPFKN